MRSVMTATSATAVSGAASSIASRTRGAALSTLPRTRIASRKRYALYWLIG